MSETAIHPLDGEDIAVEVGQGFLDRDYAATARHLPSGIAAEGKGATQLAAIAAAKDAMLKAIEETGGC